VACGRARKKQTGAWGLIAANPLLSAANTKLYSPYRLNENTFLCTNTTPHTYEPKTETKIDKDITGFNSMYELNLASDPNLTAKQPSKNSNKNARAASSEASRLASLSGSSCVTVSAEEQPK
jgi:hypothetical protein